MCDLNYLSIACQGGKLSPEPLTGSSRCVFIALAGQIFTLPNVLFSFIGLCQCQFQCALNSIRYQQVLWTRLYCWLQMWWFSGGSNQNRVMNTSILHLWVMRGVWKAEPCRINSRPGKATRYHMIQRALRTQVVPNDSQRCVTLVILTPSDNKAKFPLSH